MKLMNKQIAFGLTSSFYTFRRTIEEMKNIVLEGGKITPIMPINTYNNSCRDDNLIHYIKDIETICNAKIIIKDREVENVKADIVVIAPCSRKSYC